MGRRGLHEICHLRVVEKCLACYPYSSFLFRICYTGSDTTGHVVLLPPGPGMSSLCFQVADHPDREMAAAVVHSNNNNVHHDPVKRAPETEKPLNRERLFMSPERVRLYKMVLALSFSTIWIQSTLIRFCTVLLFYKQCSAVNESWQH